MPAAGSQSLHPNVEGILNYQGFSSSKMGRFSWWWFVFTSVSPFQQYTSLFLLLRGLDWQTQQQSLDSLGPNERVSVPDSLVNCLQRDLALSHLQAGAKISHHVGPGTGLHLAPGFLSKKLEPAQKRYSAFDGDQWPVSLQLTHFRHIQYVGGCCFTIYPDCRHSDICTQADMCCVDSSALSRSTPATFTSSLILTPSSSRLGATQTSGMNAPP
jgi:hypothetical protein